MCFRDITNATNERTAIFSIVSRTRVGHTAPIISTTDSSDVCKVLCLVTNVNSLPFDYPVWQKMGGTYLTYTILKQLPFLPLTIYREDCMKFIVPRALELIYTASDSKPLAGSVIFK